MKKAMVSLVLKYLLFDAREFSKDEEHSFTVTDRGNSTQRSRPGLIVKYLETC